MQVDVITIFPKMFEAVLGESMIRRAQERGLLRITVHNLRDFTHDKHRSVDDRPYGGGPGMVMRPEPIFEAVEAIKTANCRTILMSPQGERLSTPMAQRLSAVERLIVICGHYEGVDERVKTLVDESVSIGDYVLTGGELPALVLIDAAARFLPGVIGHAQATAEDSFAAGWLEYPQYTRPPMFRGLAVPDILLSGDHEQVAHWRKLQSVAKTLTLRPDLINTTEPQNSTEPQRNV